MFEGTKLILIFLFASFR